MSFSKTNNEKNFLMSERMNDGLSYESLEGDILPYADIEEPPVIDPERPSSEEFMLARSIIDDGIAKSKEHGYAHLKVEFWVPDADTPNGGYENRMSLAQFFGGNSLRKMVSKDEFDELSALYAEKLVEDAESSVRKFGHAAASQARTTYRSGRKNYRDTASAAAGDSLED